MALFSEKQLDAALEHAFKSDPEFARWFISKTRFADRSATYHWSRSDHPWGRVAYVVADPKTGAEVSSIKECETDVLVVFKANDGEHIALHVENKLGTGRFTAHQPELYAVRAKQWQGDPKYGSYTDFDTVLLAPRAFIQGNADQARHFGCVISHEELAEYLPQFSTYACPICSCPLRPNSRYPRYVCGGCVAKAVAPNGRPLSFSNVDATGGYMARYTDSGEEYSGHECQIGGTPCRADEARFGGIVVEALELG